MEIKLSPFVRQSTTLNIFFFLFEQLLKKEEEITFFYNMNVYVTWRFSAKICIWKYWRNYWSINEEHPETQDKKGHFIVKTNSLYNILIVVKMHNMRIPKEFSKVLCV